MPCSTMVKNGKVIQNPHAYPDQHQKSITSRGSPLAQAYHVWSTPIAAIVSYPAHRQNDRQSDRMNEREHNSASLGGVKTDTQ